MKKIALFLFILSAFTSYAYQPASLNGEWKGNRYQFDETKSKYIAVFDYSYKLTQVGNQVTGIVRIAHTDNSAFAEIAVRGFVEGSKFYFEEYEVLNAVRKEGYIWCLKKGILDIKQDESGNITLEGKTPSYMEIYGYECTGGVTYLTKEIKETEPAQEVITDIAKESDFEKSLQVTVYPNPFIENTTISFTLAKEEPVYIDVVDIQGKIITSLENKTLTPGVYNFTFTPSSAVNTSYFYVRIKVGDKTISRAIQKLDNQGDIK